MIDINRKKELRYLFLHRLYELVDGSELKRVAKADVAEGLGASPQEANDVWQYLKGEHLANPVNMAVSITHAGVVEIEKALSDPDKPTQYFPPVNIITVHHMNGSVIQQGTVGSIQSTQLADTDKIGIDEFVKKLKQALPELGLTKEADSEASADIATIDAQVGSDRPKSGIIKECLRSIQRVLEGAGGSILAQQLLPYIPALIARLGG
jgi:hypothetical protein